MKREKGFTLIEIIVATAILAILGAMIVPMLQNLNRANRQEAAIGRIDNSLRKVVDIIKRTARSAKATSTDFAIAIPAGVNERQILMNVPTEEAGTGNIVNTRVRFMFDEANRQIVVRSWLATAAEPTTSDVIAENVVAARFRFRAQVLRDGVLRGGVLTMLIRVDVNIVGEGLTETWKIREIMDSAVSRIDN